MRGSPRDGPVSPGAGRWPGVCAQAWAGGEEPERTGRAAGTGAEAQGAGVRQGPPLLSSEWPLQA